MKKLLQTSFLTLLVGLLAISMANAQGPDAFGYTWKKSTDAGGPTFNWIDITSVGTLVTGLGDDNAVPFIPMGMDFHYYWSDYDQIKIGSNGWLSFDNVSNIASCFAAIPTANAQNNLICPLMSDLNFANNSPGKMYTYHDQTPGDEKFIISYEEVTFWTQTNPIFGSNTFQVILSKADSSITFQYLNMNTDFTYTCNTGSKVVVGMENLTGNIGLQVFNGTVPPSNLAVKFYYPQVITFSVVDASPSSNINVDNEGILLFPGSTVTLSTTISNAGNTDISTPIAIESVVQSFPNGFNVFTEDQSIPSLAVGADQTVNFTTTTIDWDPGVYAFGVQTDNSADVNPTNDLNVTEIGVVDTTGGVMFLGYVTGANAGANLIQWAGGGDGSSGAGIEVEPPIYPLTIAGVEAGIATGSIDGMTFKIFDDDGPNGGPGTVLSSQTVDAGDYIAGAWNQYLLDDAVTIESGSFYLGWFMDGNTVGLMTESEGPISNRAYEVLSNSWAKYRVTADLMLRAIAEVPVIIDGVDDILEDSKLAVYPSPNNGTFQVDNSLGNTPIESLQVVNTLGTVVHTEKLSVAIGQQQTVRTDLPSGIYYLNLKTSDGKRVVRKVAVN